VPDTKLFNQYGAVTNQLRSGLRIPKRCERVGLTEKNKDKSGDGETAVGDPQCFQ